MRIKLINPNTTDSMTESCVHGARPYVRPGTELYGVCPQTGPASIECYYEDYLCVPGLLAEIRRGEIEGADAYVVACFGDPGLLAAREATDKPVVGIAEAAIITARLLATSFSIVTILHRARHLVEAVVRQNGAQGWCRSIRTTDMGVLDFERDPQRGLAILADECRRAVRDDRAEAVILGCAGFTQFAHDLRGELGVPVIDGVVPAVKLAEALVDMGCKTSKVWTLSPPPAKEIKGFPALQQVPVP